MRFAVSLLALISVSPAFADGFALISFPVSIPQECVVVAQREHVSTIMNSKAEIIQAALKLDRLKGRDPAVAQCKQTVARLRAFF